MEPMEIVGVKKTSFTAKDTGDVISGYNIYCLYDVRGVEGRACERLFVTSAKLGQYVPAVGDVVEVVYNRFGKVASVTLVD